MKILKRVTDNRQLNSLATVLRRKRFALFKALVTSLPRPLKVLDVGGTQIFWETMGFCGEKGTTVVLLNLREVLVTYQNFYSVVGDARDMRQFEDEEFDVVFSNSVIEHVGDYDDQRRMATEVRRVGKRYFIQTPNRYFPIEPHFLFPFFQFLPLKIRVGLVSHFNLGWYKRVTDREKAFQTVSSIRLLNEKEIMELLPNGAIFREKFLGLTKSFIVYGGWDASSHHGPSSGSSLFRA